MELEMDYLQGLHLTYLVCTLLFTSFLTNNAESKNGCKFKIFKSFGISYLIITVLHIIILAQEKTLIDETPLSKQDPYSYILFVVSFAWAFLLLTYKGRCLETNK